MKNKKNIAFNFGENWSEYSKNSLDNQKFDEALNSLEKLINKNKIKNSRFLDIGCGSGIFAIAASKLGAINVVGIDISKESINTSLQNKKRFASKNKIQFFHKSVFDKEILDLNKFDIVYSWGVLHHTGNMLKAIEISSKLVEKKGLFVIALYNKHWSSFSWKLIKRIYNFSPKLIRTFMVGIFFGIIALAKFLVTRKNPFAKKKRGMTFYYDLVDWLGGYPYEYASKSEIKSFVEKEGFKLVKYNSAEVPTGCNEFVFKRLK